LGEVLLRANDARLAKTVGLVTRVTGSGGVLTAREREIMDHVMQGMTNRGIAASLFISSGTVKSHLDHIFQKLGVRTRAEAVARYAEMENADTDES
jgi:ATP/maltotriose-dependent transcriptional regulator MalT